METVLLVVLAVAFAVAGGMKVLGLGPTRANFERWTEPVSKWVSPTVGRLVTGVIELVIFAAAVAGLAGNASGTQIAALLTLWVMVGALAAHSAAGDPRKDTIPVFVLLAVAIGLLVVTT